MKDPRRSRPLSLAVCSCLGVLLLLSPYPAAAAGPRPAAVLVEARTAASMIEEAGERAAAVDTLLSVQVAVDPAGAKETLRQFPRLPRRLDHFVSLSSSYADHANVGEAEKMYAEIRLEDPTSERGTAAAMNARGYLAIAYARAGQIDEALQTLSQMKAIQPRRDPAILATALSAIAMAQAKRGDIAGGFRTATSIARDHPSALVDLVADRLKAGASEILELVSKLDDTLQSYGQWGIVKAQIGLGKSTDAQLTASSMKPGHAKGSALLDLANHHLSAGRPPIAAGLLQEAATAAQEVPAEATRAELLRRIAKAMAEARDIEGALETARSIQTDAQRDAALGDIVRTQAAQHDIRGALNNAILLKRDQPTDPGNLSAYESALSDIVAEWAKAGGAKDALETVGGLGQLQPRQRLLYARIARAQAERGDVRGARATLQLADSADQRAARDKELDRLLNLAMPTAGEQEQLKSAQQMDLAVSLALKALAAAHARKGEIREAYLITTALRVPHRSGAIMELSVAQIRSGRTEQAVGWSRGLAHQADKTYALIGVAQGLAAGRQP